MNRVQNFRRLGTLLFVLMWVPFSCIFVGMASEFGRPGQWLADKAPALLSPGPSGASTLTMVSFVFTFGMMFAAMALIFGSPLLAWFQNRRLLNSGRKATARILTATQTGTYINENPVVHFTLEVEPPSGQPFDAEAEQLVNQMQIPRFQPGELVQVRYDPDTLEVTISDELAA
jgi:hypothetical protein